MRVSLALTTSLLLHALAAAAVVAATGKPAPESQQPSPLQLTLRPTAATSNPTPATTGKAPVPAPARASNAAITRVPSSTPSSTPSSAPSSPQTPPPNARNATADSAATLPAAATAAAAATPLREEPPRFDAAYLGNPQADYPPAALRRRLEGTVTLEVRVDPHGHPAQIAIASSSGAELLDEAAIAAVRRWRFIPARLGQESVAGSVRVPVRFRLPA